MERLSAEERERLAEAVDPVVPEEWDVRHISVGSMRRLLAQVKALEQERDVLRQAFSITPEKAAQIMHRTAASHHRWMIPGDVLQAMATALLAKLRERAGMEESKPEDACPMCGGPPDHLTTDCEGRHEVDA